MRFVVVGTSGAGKSTFAGALAAAACCPHVELDRLYWAPGWQAVPVETFERSVRAATAEDRWVVDGNYSVVRELLWSRATHIIWLNPSRSTVMSRVLSRTMRRLFLRTPICNGNRESFRMTFFSKDSILLYAFATFSRNRRKYTALRQDPAYGHLQWLEIAQSVKASEFVRSQDRGAALRAQVVEQPGT